MRTTTTTLLLVLTGCGSSAMSEMGVTPGGMQDIAYARDLIAEGLIPAAEDYTVEGLFSEHDLPLDGAPCDALLCPRAAAAHVTPVDGSGEQLLVQLGFATDLDAETFERPDLSLAVAIDISGSMDGDKLETSKAALHEVVDQLGPNDRMALVTYGSTAKVKQKLTVMDNAGRADMHDEIDQLSSGGSTAMEAGLDKAIDQLLSDAPPASQASRRVFLVTDAQPNVGATGVDSFVGLARDAANADIGLTVWGVGLDLGAELVAEMSKLRGGNAYHFVDVDSMRSRVQDEFDHMVTPLAYDLVVTGIADPELTVDRTWGAPVNAAGEVSFGAATLFPSTRDGGMGVTLTWSDGGPILVDAMPASLVTLSASWLPVDGQETESADVAVSFAGGQAYADSWAAADDLGVFKMGALIDEVLSLDAGALFCTGELDPDTADARIEEAAQRLATRAAALDDEGLGIESELMLALLENVRGGAANCHGI